MSLQLTMVSAVVIGLVLAPFGTYYSLVLDRLADLLRYTHPPWQILGSIDQA